LIRSFLLIRQKVSRLIDKNQKKKKGFFVNKPVNFEQNMEELNNTRLSRFIAGKNPGFLHVSLRYNQKNP